MSKIGASLSNLTRIAIAAAILTQALMAQSRTPSAQSALKGHSLEVPPEFQFTSGPQSKSVAGADEQLVKLISAIPSDADYRKETSRILDEVLRRYPDYADGYAQRAEA